MKKAFLIIALFVGFAAFAQQETTVAKPESDWTITCIPRAITANLPVIFCADDFYRSTITKPVAEFNSLQNWALSKELPFMHTINGSIYTFDFLRNQVRY